MIYQTVNFNSFHNAFINYGRENQFSYAGLRMLFDYINALSDDIGQDIELDVIALCCQYSELDKAGFLLEHRIDGIESIEELEQALLDGTIDCVIAYDLEENIILVNDDY